MSNEDLVENIKYFQESSVMAPFVCECETKYRAKVENDAVVLVCPGCNDLRETIPEIPLISQIKAMEDAMKNMYSQAIEQNQPQEPDTEEKRTITYDVTFRVTETLYFDPADWDEDIDTMDKYQAYQMDSKKEYREEMFVELYESDYEISNVKVVK